MGASCSRAVTSDGTDRSQECNDQELVVSFKAAMAAIHAHCHVAHHIGSSASSVVAMQQLRVPSPRHNPLILTTCSTHGSPRNTSMTCFAASTRSLSCASVAPQYSAQSCRCASLDATFTQHTDGAVLTYQGLNHAGPWSGAQSGGDERRNERQAGDGVVRFLSVTSAPSLDETASSGDSTTRGPQTRRRSHTSLKSNRRSTQQAQPAWGNSPVAMPLDHVHPVKLALPMFHLY